MRLRSRIWLGALALAFAAALSLHAGEGKEKWDKLKAELGLSDAQVTQLQQKFEAISAQGEEAERKSRVLREEMEAAEKRGDEKTAASRKAELETLHQEWSERTMGIWRSVLTKEQLTKFEEMKAKNHKNEHEGKEHNEKK